MIIIIIIIDISINKYIHQIIDRPPLFVVFLPPMLLQGRPLNLILLTNQRTPDYLMHNSPTLESKDTITGSQLSLYLFNFVTLPGVIVVSVKISLIQVTSIVKVVCSLSRRFKIVSLWVLYWLMKYLPAAVSEACGLLPTICNVTYGYLSSFISYA